MRAPFMGGSFPFPVKYGYATVGRVEAGPDELGIAQVFALHPHQTRFDLAAEAVIPLPAGVAAAARGARRQHGDRAQRGLGRRAGPGRPHRGGRRRRGRALVGLPVRRLPGAEVTLVDIDPSRAPLAAALGVRFADAGRSAGRLRSRLPCQRDRGRARDRARIAGDEATVVELSWYGEGDVAVPLGGAFHSRRLRLVSSQVGKVAPSHRPRWSYRRRLAAALDAAGGRSARCAARAGDRVRRLAGAPAAMSSVAQSGAVCPVIRYPGAESAR